ncbi:hypothetical protein DL766_008861 [Monosporascus sp. MC13-8B]|nr:hypothetical protein DL763_002082 [Monosporascus cannonballus]RYP17660.1 hypothetical protein DL766_008861 [Monosporascus sp. MC13-8B]
MPTSLLPLDANGSARYGATSSPSSSSNSNSSASSSANRPSQCYEEAEPVSAVAPAPGAATAAREAVGDGSSPGRGILARLSPDPVPDEMWTGISSDPVPSLYTEAQIVFDGINYFNERVSGDLISISTHFNPYQVSLRRIDTIPRIYVSLLVTAATLHRSMQLDDNFARSSALAQREEDIFRFRIRALQDVNYRLSKKDTQTSDSTLMCVICLLLSTVSSCVFAAVMFPLGADYVAQMQQSAYTDWRAHLEGARRIIQLRGGIKEIITKNPYFKPLMTLFICIDVMAATTTPSTHKSMAVATSMALHYWEAEPGIFQSNLAVSSPCPEELFQTLILVNYLRSISHKDRLKSRRQSGTRMVLKKLRSFNPAEWATRMKGFKGWKKTGDGVEFDTPLRGACSPRESQSPEPAPQRGQTGFPASDHHHQHHQHHHHQNNNLPSPPYGTPPSLTAKSSDIPESDLWLNIAVIYRAAITLYTVRTLVLDLREDKAFLYEEEPDLDIITLRLDARQQLAAALAPIFSDHASARTLGKLVFFPMFVCGMEAGPNDRDLQDFIANGLERVGQACGTFGPIGAVDELRGKWAADAQAPKGTHVTWDEYFEGRPDFVFGF